MASDIEYGIRITFDSDISVSGGGNEEQPSLNKGAKTPKNKEASGSTIGGTLKTIGIINLARGGFNLATSNIGTLTGSAYKQDQFKSAAKFMGYGVMLLNPATAGVAAASMAIELASGAINQAKERLYKEREYEYQRQKVGKIITSRSRN